MRYYLIAGEASGDLHGSNLIKALAAEDHEAEFRFWGGDLMQKAVSESCPGCGDCPPVVHYREGAVMGLTDVLKKLFKVISNVGVCKKDILKWKPDVVIPIDYPGFNMKIAGFCHKKGIRLFYYIAPKTWASRAWRNRSLKKWVDRLFIVFPFEVPYFQKAGIPFVYKGNPLLDAVDSHHFSPVTEKNYVAILPGSRKSEIDRMMPVCMEVADRIGQHVIVAGAPGRSMDDYAPWLVNHPDVEVVFDRTYDILKFAEAAVINSGTASLEACLIGTPQVVCWSTTPFTAWFARKVLHVLDHVKYISLGNLCIDKPAFKEFLQQYFTYENVVEELNLLTGNTAYREKMLKDYADIRKSLGGSGASSAVAKALIDELRRG